MGAQIGRKDGTDTRAMILKTALQLFLKEGYKNVTYQDLMKKTGLSKGAIYHHFASKEELLASVFAFMLELTKQHIKDGVADGVKDVASFRKVFIEGKQEQIAGFKKMMGSKTLKLNKLLFFLEAINENEKIKTVIEELMEQEISFLEKCFEALGRHKQLPKGKDPKQLAGCLFWMLQGGEMKLFLQQDGNPEEDLIRGYDKTISDFFSII